MKYSALGIVFFLIPLLHLLSCNTEQKPYLRSDRSDIEKARAHESYKNNCTSCHSLFKDATGPALSDALIDSRSEEWLYTFLTNPSKIKNDKGLQKRQKEYAPLRCIMLDTITTVQQKEIKLIIAYLKKYKNQLCTY